MHRRTFLFTVAASLITGRTSAPIRRVQFRVAGVRFSKASRWPNTGDVVTLRTERWQEETAIAVYFGSERIGYVPRRQIAAVACRRGTWTVVSAAHQAVPWKRYLVQNVG